MTHIHEIIHILWCECEVLVGCDTFAIVLPSIIDKRFGELIELV